MIKHLGSFTATALVAIALSFGAAPISAVAAPPVSNQLVASVTTVANDTAAPAAAIRWVPYDYAKITSETKCNSRMSYLKRVAPDIKHWKCELAGYTQTCPSNAYWYVYSGFSDNVRLASDTFTSAETLKSAATAAAC